MQSTKTLIRNGAIYAGLAVASIAVPLLIWTFSRKVDLNSTSGSSTDLFAYWTNVNVLLVTLLFFFQRGYRSDTSWAKKILCLVLLQSALLIGGSGVHRAWDSFPPQNAARAIVEGKNPYLDTGMGASPPLIAEIQVVCLRSCTAILHLCHKEANTGLISSGIFYAFQCGQLLATGMLFWLLYQYVKAITLSENRAALITGALMLFNGPLQSTLIYNQINVWVTLCALVGILFATRRVLLSAAAIALGTHLKIYPVMLIPSMFFTSRLKTAFAAVAGIVLLAQAQAYCCGDTAIWQEWLNALKQGGSPFSDHHEMPMQTTIAAVVYHCTNMVSRLTGIGFTALEPLAKVVLAAGSLLVVAWFCYRFVRRRSTESPASQSYYFAVCNDALCALLLIFPHVWEHHYVLALPIAAYAIARGQRFQLAIAGAFLTFAFYPPALLENAPWMMLQNLRMLGIVLLACSYAPGGEQSKTENATEKQASLHQAQ